MKTKKGKAKGFVIPTNFLISDIEDLCKGVLTEHEIKVFNTYSYFLDIDETSRHLREWPYHCIEVLAITNRKLEFLYSLKSPEDFKEGILTKREFLSAPIIIHGFSTRLYHNLIQTELFNLKEVNALGIDELRGKRGIGEGQIEEIIGLFEKKGWLHLVR